MQYWLFKSEPSCFSITDLSRSSGRTSPWDGVRNYQARNMMRDDMQVGDRGFFYHSSCTPPGIAGVVEIVKAGYPDETAWDSHSDHFDPKSTPEKPRWYRVDVKLVQLFPRLITLAELKQQPALTSMLINRKGNRLSITSVTATEWQAVMALL